MQMQSFVLHHYIKQKLSSSYIEHKPQFKSSKGTSALQVDFAENYCTFYQNEIQSALWHKTLAIWQCGECVPAEVVSVDLSHSMESVLIFRDTLLTFLLQSDVKILHVWFDSPSPKFKNCFISNFLPWFESKFNLKVHWNFFASSH